MRVFFISGAWGIMPLCLYGKGGDMVMEGACFRMCVLRYFRFIAASVFLRVGKDGFLWLLYMALVTVIACKTAKVLSGSDLCLLVCGLLTSY